MATIETAKETERGIVDMETLKATNESLIATLDEVMKIQTEGKEKRRAAEVELNRMEGELKQKLLEIHQYREKKNSDVLEKCRRGCGGERILPQPFILQEERVYWCFSLTMEKNMFMIKMIVVYTTNVYENIVTVTVVYVQRYTQEEKIAEVLEKKEGV